MAFQISVTGISVAARPMEMKNSSMLTEVKPKRLHRPGTKITPQVSTIVHTSASQSHLFWVFMVKMELWTERAVKARNISTKLQVKNAMVMPSLLWAKLHTPFSRRSPKK